MGILTILKDVANRQMLDGTQGQFYPRGLTLPLDVFTDGKVRFGRKIGFPFPIIVPDNRFEIAVDAVFGIDSIEIDRDPGWIEPGGFVTIGERELHEVEDVTEGDGTFILTLTTSLLADHLEGQFVFHHGNPIEVEGAFLRGQDVIIVDSRWFIVRGDVIAIPTSTELVLSFREYRVDDLIFVSETVVGGETIFEYQLTLDKPIHRDLDDGEEIQIRAYPAYQSKILSVPTQAGPRKQIRGPFLVDWMSGPFLTDTPAEETQTLQRYTKLRTLIGVPLEIEKNHMILHVPIDADQFLFWDKVEGSINYDADLDRLMMLPDDDGNWWLKYTCVPPIEVPFTNAGGTIVTPAASAFLDNEGFILDDSIDAIRFEYKATVGYVATAEAAATGIITVAAPPPYPADNDFFTLDDGFGNSVTFEYERTGAFLPSDPANRPIDITSAVNATDIVIATVNAINAVTFLGVTAVNASPSVNLSNDVISQRGNQTLVMGAGLTAIAWTSSGMSGGTNDVETVDVSTVTTALEVAQLTAAAINRQRLRILADFPTAFAGFRIRNELPGPAGNIPIIEFVADAGFITTGMTGGSGGAQWHFEITPDQDALLRIRMFPNDFQDYNLVNGVTSTIVVELDADDDPVERIDLVIKSTGGGEILMGDWNINGIRVGAIRHEYVARVIGEHNYGSSTSMVKPIFQSLEDLQLKKDINHRLDGGFLRL